MYGKKIKKYDILLQDKNSKKTDDEYSLLIFNKRIISVQKSVFEKRRDMQNKSKKDREKYN